MTKYGWPEVLLFPFAVLGAMVLAAVLAAYFLQLWVFLILEAVLAVLLIWLLSFFRDPYRLCPLDKSLMLAPADGKIISIEQVDENSFINGPALRISIFLNIFNVHINRSPCNARVEKLTYRSGHHKHAATPQAGRSNESNDLSMIRNDDPKDKLIVRQISGAVARRIVCTAAEGQNLAVGEKFGMIKFGSRTELYLAAGDRAKCLVKIGDKVAAGVTPLVKYN